jgi:hypothetical protein
MKYLPLFLFGFWTGNAFCSLLYDRRDWLPYDLALSILCGIAVWLEVSA